MRRGRSGGLTPWRTFRHGRGGHTGEMRVIDCDECGETLTAENDAALATMLTDHMHDRHDEELEEEQADAVVAEQAYDATDA